jgi:hypothetical protein
MRRSFLVLLLILPFPLSAQTLILTDEQWPVPHRARTLVPQPGFGELMSALDRQPQGALIVRHGSGETALQRAEELKTWLVALGLPAARVVLERDSGLDGKAQVAIEARSYGARP